MRCGAEDFGRGRTLFCRQKRRQICAGLCRIFSQAPEPEDPPEAALCQGDSMPPPVCRGSGRTVMFHTADSRGGIQTDQSWGRYWRFFRRAGGAAGRKLQTPMARTALHHKSCSNARQLSVTSGFQSAPGKGRGQ